MCFDFLYKVCLKYFSFQEEFGENVTCCHVKYPLLLSVLIRHELSLLIFNKYSNINIMKIRPLGPELFHSDGQT
jgi:hypothetical protein